MENGDDGDKTADAKRPANWNGDSAAMRALEEAYGDAIRSGTLHAHELRQRDPKLYEALCQLFARNKAKDLVPARFADVMSVDPEAKNGWKSRAPTPPPSPEEALAILLKQREASRKRKQRWRQGKAGDAHSDNAESQPVGEPHRSGTVPAKRRSRQNTCD